MQTKFSGFQMVKTRWQPFWLVSRSHSNSGPLQTNLFKTIWNSDISVFQIPTEVYSGDLNIGLVWYSNGQKLSDLQMPFEYRTKFSPVFRPPCEYQTTIQMVVWITNYHLNTRHLNTRRVKVHYSDVSVIQMFVIQITTVVY